MKGAVSLILKENQYTSNKEEEKENSNQMISLKQREWVEKEA